MENITYKSVSYNELACGLAPVEDPYAIISDERRQREKIFTDNPRHDGDDTYMFLVFDGGKAVGRCYYFKTLFKAGEQTIPALSASALAVAEPFRHSGLGADIVLHTVSYDKYPVHVFAGIAPMALAMYKKLKYTIFAIPEYRLFLNSKAYLANKGIRGMALSVASKIVNFFWHRKCKAHGKPSGKFTVRQLDVVPEWVDDISLNDGHKYMEQHDHEWMQWNLSGSFAGKKGDYRRFYGVYMEEKPIGFFMTKRNVTIETVDMSDGYVVEWGTKDALLLSETDIYKLAISTFGMDVSDIIVGSVDADTQDELSKMGFKYIADEHVAVKDLHRSFSDIADKSLWRLRIGYADTIFS